jgi:hypothetical protein
MGKGWDGPWDWYTEGQSLSREDYLEDQDYLALEDRFRQAFGDNFQEFSYDAYLNDADYRNRIIHSIEESGGARGGKWYDPKKASVLGYIHEKTKDTPEHGAKHRALQDILEYHKKAAAKPKPDDNLISPEEIEAVYGPLRAELARLIEQQVQYGRAEINRGTSRIQDKVREGLAGSGVGTSGVAAHAYSDAAGYREGKIEDFTNRTRMAGAQADFGLQSSQADKEYQQLLIDQDWTREDAVAATNYRRQLRYMREGAMLQAAANEPSFLEEWAPLFQMAGTAAGLYFGGPAGAAAGSQLTSSIFSDTTQYGWEPNIPPYRPNLG